MLPRSVHFIGIKGKGLSALAAFCVDLGIQVTGSDVSETFSTDSILNKLGITPQVGFKGAHLKTKPEIIVASPAFNTPANPEIVFAKRHHIPVVGHLELFNRLIEGRELIAIAGTHGKTTTTALVTALLVAGGLDPGYLVGWDELPPPMTTPGHAGSGPVVAEADEYQVSSQDPTPKFLALKPTVAVIGSIEFDHPDQFVSLDAVYDAYYRFAARVRRGGIVIGGIDSPRLRRLRSTLVDRNFETFGFAPDADWRIMDEAIVDGQQTFTVRTKGEKRGPFRLGIPGRHNVLNALAALAVARHYNVSWPVIENALERFSGVGRRFQVVGTFGGFTLVDDYAHHPSALRAVIETARSVWPQHHIWIAFQPHTYSRTQAMLDEFVNALGTADRVIILPTFASAREAPQGYDPADELIKRLAAAHHPVFRATLEELPGLCRDKLSTRDILLSVGAGSIAKAPEYFKKEFA